MPLEMPRPFGDNGGDGATVELVLFGNAFAAVGIGLVALVRWELSLVTAAAVVAAAFAFLGGCLLFRSTVWIAALLGGGAAALGPTLLLTAVGLRLSRAAGWAGGGVGLALGLQFARRSYLRLGARAGRNPLR